MRLCIRPRSLLPNVKLLYAVWFYKDWSMF